MKKLRLFCDPLVVAMASAWLFLAIPCLVVGLIFGTLIYEGSNIKTAFDVVIVIIFYIMHIVLLITSLKCVPQWFDYIKIDSHGITYCAPFSKKIIFSYEDFKHIKIACYTHIYEKRFFLVLSRKVIPESVLINVNQLKCDSTVIKIKISNRRYRILSEILPANIREKFMYSQGEISSDSIFDIDAKLKMQKKRDRFLRRKNSKKRQKRRKK